MESRLRGDILAVIMVLVEKTRTLAFTPSERQQPAGQPVCILRLAKP